MSFNRVVLNGKIPYFEGNFKAGESSFLAWAISVKRNYKPEGEQYYKEDLINFKAFGPKADFISKHFKSGDGIIIEGRLQRDDDYEKDNQTIKGQLSVIVENVYFPDGKKQGDSEESGSSSKSSEPKQTGAPKPPAKPGFPGAATGGKTPPKIGGKKPSFMK